MLSAAFLSLVGYVVFYCAVVAACGFLFLLYQKLASDR